MNARMYDILEELYLIDPALRDEEETLKKALKELIESKPDAHMDEAFAAELKAKLLAEFSKGEGAKPAKAAAPESRRKRAGLAFARPELRVGLGVAAAAALLVAVYVGVRPWGSGIQPMGDAAIPGNATAITGTPSDAQAAAKGEPKGALQPIAKPEKGKAREAVAPDTKGAIADKDDTYGMSQPKENKAAEAGFTGHGVVPQGPSASSAAAVAPAYEAEKQDLAASDSLREEARGLARSVQTPSTAPSAAKDKKAAAPSQALAQTAASGLPADALIDRTRQDFNTEGYDRVVETSFAKVLEDPLSTFSIDVDTASYANVRRFLRSGSMPPPDAVRIEELVNYFPYEYAGPEGDEPFAFDSELTPCPWNPEHSLLRIALQAKRISDREIPPSNLVFLIDVSGSMEDENKLPLVKEALKLLARKMRQEDKISIVVYAGSAGIVLEPTAGSKTQAILKAIDALESGGSTAGGEGIRLAYAAAKKAFLPKGSNRVILATDGDFNIGASSDGELVRIIEEERKAGIYLTVLGFGMGNYKDSKMQKLADSGNGNYAYVDTLSEAEKILSRQMAGTLFTVAKDVKVQIEFNPARVGEYRLIGYEKRALAARDFADDAKDAGELGAGASVTALYELIPPSGAAAGEGLKYQSRGVTADAAKASELMTIKFRYKKPELRADGQDQKSILSEEPVDIAQRDIAKASADFRFAAAVAEWGLLLRGSEYRGGASLGQVLSLARASVGSDPGGYRAEFIELVKLAQGLGR